MAAYSTMLTGNCTAILKAEFKQFSKPFNGTISSSSHIHMYITHDL